MPHWKRNTLVILFPQPFSKEMLGMSINVLGNPLMQATFVVGLQNPDEPIFPAWKTTVQQGPFTILDFSQRRPTLSRRSVATNMLGHHTVIQPKLINEQQQFVLYTYCICILRRHTSARNESHCSPSCCIMLCTAPLGILVKVMSEHQNQH